MKTIEDLAQALGELEKTPDRVATLVKDLSRSAQTSRNPPTAFSILENVWHLRDIEVEGHLARIRRLLAEEGPVLPDVDGERLARERNYNEQLIEPAVEEFRSARLASVTTLRALPREAFERSGTLETAGVISLQDLVFRMRDHDRGHLEDLSRLRALQKE